MAILALDTSSSNGSAALLLETGEIQEITFAGSHRHSSTLVPALAAWDIASLNLEKIIVGLGPGSFSGIRVGIAAAQGLAVVFDTPIFGIPSTYAVAAAFLECPRLGIFADARRGEAYVTVFSKGTLEQDTYLVPHSQIPAEAARMDLAVSAEPLAGIPERATPLARHFFTIPESHPAWVAGTALEPVYLREAALPPVTS